MTAKYPSQTFEDQIQQWAAASDTGQEGDLILSDQDIRDFVQENIADIGNLTLDPGDLPVTADERQQVFFDEADLLRHWVSSGLIFWDANDNIIPNAMLYILVEEDPISGSLTYKVYVDYDET